MSIVNINALKQQGAVLYWPGAVASANAPKAITANGDVKQILPFPGAGIGMFDGTGDYLTVPNSADFNISANGSFTFKTWYYHISGTPAFIGTCPGTASTAGWFINVYQNQLWFSATTGTSSWNICNIGSSALTWTTNTWYHIEVSLNAGMLYLFRDGILLTSSVMTSAIPSSRALYIGYDGVQTNSYLNGYLAELQFINGVAGHTTNFTPPRRQLESDSNTKLLLHFNRNDNTFIDSSPSAHTITAYGNAKQLCSPCGSGVAYFDGTGDYLSIADSSVLELGAGNWTIQGRIYLSTVGRRNGIICKNDTTARYPALMLEVNASNRLALTMSSNGSSNDIANAVEGTTTTFAANTWYDIKIVRNGTSIIVYVNGNAEISITSSATPVDSSYAWGIGCVATDGTGSLHGYISEFEYASTTRSLTIATQPFTPDPYTKLLLHMDGVGNAFYDSSDPPGDNGFPILPDGVTVTPNGTFTTQKMKDGRNVWVFNGSTNYITISDHASWSMFLNDFTIAAWIKFDSITANKTIIGQYTDTNNQWFVRWTTSNVIQLYGITSSTARFDFTCPLTPVAGTWYHVVIQRSGSSCVMYINGVAQTVTQTTAFSATATDIAAVLSIGNINTEYQAGNTKDLQIFHKALTTDQIAAIMQETYIY